MIKWGYKLTGKLARRVGINNSEDKIHINVSFILRLMSVINLLKVILSPFVKLKF